MACWAHPRHPAGGGPKKIHEVVRDPDHCARPQRRFTMLATLTAVHGHVPSDHTRQRRVTCRPAAAKVGASLTCLFLCWSSLRASGEGVSGVVICDALPLLVHVRESGLCPVGHHFKQTCAEPRVPSWTLVGRANVFVDAAALCSCRLGVCCERQGALGTDSLRKASGLLFLSFQGSVFWLREPQRGCSASIIRGLKRQCTDKSGPWPVGFRGVVDLVLGP